MGSGLSWKRNEEDALDRRRRFLRREMQDSILAVLPVAIEAEEDWRAFRARWRWERYTEGEERPFPSNEEILDRVQIGLQQRGQVEDDWLPVIYSVLDSGDDMPRGLFGQPMRFFHRSGAAYSSAPPVLADWAGLDALRFSLTSPWARKLLDLEDYFERHADGRFAQHNQLTMDGLNFVMMMRGNTQVYIDIYESPEELRRLLEIGLDFNIRFQEAQFERIRGYRDGCFVWLAEWAPFPRAISFSVDAYVLCSARTYVEFGIEYQSRLIKHFGHGLMHFHCNRADLAAEVAKLPGLELFQYGAGLPLGPPDYTYLPEIRKAVGEIPIMVNYPLEAFRHGLAGGTLMPNVLYHLSGGPLGADEANRLMDAVRAYRA
jgi:hypothetical protein